MRVSLFSFFRRSPRRDLPPLRFRNTLSDKLETFEPLGGPVKMYNCGPTVYDVQHVGNLFPPVIANILHRSLVVWGYKVQEVNNITDFGHISEDEDSEDKMSKGLRREGLALTLKNMRKLAEKYAELFFADLPLLGVNIKYVTYPRASDYIDEQVALIQTLEQKGFAYKTSDGVYFDTVKFVDYGKLGGIDLMGQSSKSRVGENPEKKHGTDFALWKLDKKLGWKSPWGLGFPGWHTECVAMIFKRLGKQIDIHMGGSDLIPIHHNNEIAQAEAATGKPFVHYWIHNAHITVEGKKISKSLGNTIYLHQLVDRGLSPRSLRYWFLTGHYRTPMNFTWEALEGANTALTRLQRTYLEMTEGKIDQEFMKKFYGIIGNDLNTAQALALIWEELKKLNRATLREADNILGLGLADVRPIKKIIPNEVKELEAKREAARSARNFAEADELRKKIEEKGFVVKDTPEGSVIQEK